MRVVKVLYLEDDPEDAQLFRSALHCRERRYYVEVATRTIDAIHLVWTMPLDIVIADISLETSPHGDHFIECLAESEVQTSLAILTCHDLNSLDRNLLDLVNQGKVTFINKQSISAAELPGIIEQVISRQVSILHVDQDRIFSAAAADTMKVASPPYFRLTHADSPDEATRILCREYHFDTMIADLDFKRGDVESTLELLKNAVETPRVRTAIILLTDRKPHEMPPEIRRCLERKSIVCCSKAHMSVSSLTNAILTQRANRRVPDLFRSDS